MDDEKKRLIEKHLREQRIAAIKAKLAENDLKISVALEWLLESAIGDRIKLQGSLGDWDSQS